MNSTNPHILALSVQLAFYLICFLKNKYVAVCFSHKLRPLVHCEYSHLGWQEVCKETGNQDSLRNGDLILSKSCSDCEMKGKLWFKRICCQFCLMSVHIQWGSNASAVSIVSVSGLIFHTEKGSNVGSSVHDREPKNIQKNPL